MESSGLRSDFPHFIHEDVKVTLQSDFVSIQLFEKLLTWLRSPPLMTTVRVNPLNTSQEIAKEKLQEYLHAEYGTRFTVECHPNIRDVLVIPSSEESSDNLHPYSEAIVDVRCGAAVLRGSNVFAPGVLALSPGVKPGDQVSIFVDMRGTCRRGYIKNFDGLKTFIGNGISVVSRNELFTTNKPKGIAIRIVEPISPSIGSCMEDVIFLQNLPSVICSQVLNPLPNEWVLDMCAAPGGKTTHLATLMNDRGKVIALDKTKAKIDVIQSNSSRFGLKCVTAFVCNAIKAVDVKLNLKITSDLAGPGAPPYPRGIFDRILLDAPCSALGQRPQLCINTSTPQLNSYPALQKKLFSTAVDLLKDGGTLVYSTCTFTLAENERVVEWALSSFPVLKLDIQKPHVGESGFAGTSLTPDELSLLQRFDFRCNDFYLSNSIGFFIAKFIKKVL